MDFKVKGGQRGRAPHFLELATEIRLQIYSYLVVVGKVFYSPDDFTLVSDARFKGCFLYRKPELKLLRVCQQIHDEAEELYLSKNLFVLPDFFHFRNPINLDSLGPSGHIPFPDRPLFSRNAAKWLKHVSISFNPRLPAPHMLGRSKWQYLDGLNPARMFDNMTPAERLTFAHDHAKAGMEDAWIESVTCLTKFLCSKDRDEGEDSYEHDYSDEEEDSEDDGCEYDDSDEDSKDESEGRTLLNLELDFTNTYCPLGCCRLDVHIAPLLGNTRPANVTLRGLRNKEEKDRLLAWVREDYGYSMNIDLDERYRNLSTEDIIKVHNMKFDPEEDVWSKWKKVQRPRKIRTSESFEDFLSMAHAQR
jgi:hypothetical protein